MTSSRRLTLCILDGGGGGGLAAFLKHANSRQVKVFGNILYSRWRANK